MGQTFVLEIKQLYNLLSFRRESKTRRSSQRKVSFKEVEEIPEDKDLPEVDTLRIFRMNAKEWPFILGGGVASLVMGASMPVYAVLFGEVLGLLSEPVSLSFLDPLWTHSLTNVSKAYEEQWTSVLNSVVPLQHLRGLEKYLVAAYNLLL